MFKVEFTASVFDADTEETMSGWVNPDWSRWTLYTDSWSAGSKSFDTKDGALVYIDETLGAIVGGERGAYAAVDAYTNMETGEVWSLTAHVTEVHEECECSASYMGGRHTPGCPADMGE